MLAAIAEGNNTKEGIASYIGRDSGDLANLNVLQDCGGTRHEPCSCSPGGRTRIWDWGTQLVRPY